MNEEVPQQGDEDAAASAALALVQQRQAEQLLATFTQPGNPSTPSVKRARADAEYLSLMFNPAAIELVRLRERIAYGSTPRIPLYCSGHRTGVGLQLMISNEIDEGTPVPDHIEMLCLPDPKAVKAGTADQGKSYTLHCSACGRSTRRQDAWLLNAALKCLGNTPGKGGYRITIT